MWLRKSEHKARDVEPLSSRIGAVTMSRLPSGSAQIVQEGIDGSSRRVLSHAAAVAVHAEQAQWLASALYFQAEFMAKPPAALGAADVWFVWQRGQLVVSPRDWLCRVVLGCLPPQGLDRGREPGAFLSKTISRNVLPPPRALPLTGYVKAALFFRCHSTFSGGRRPRGSGWCRTARRDPRRNHR